MSLTSIFKENEGFKNVLRNKYSEEVCDIVMEWTEEALRYVFKESNETGKFLLGIVDSQTCQIEYTGEIYDCHDVLCRVIGEMELALEDKDNESRESIEEELRILSMA